MLKQKSITALRTFSLAAWLLLDATWALAVGDGARAQHQERAQRLRHQALERATGVRISTPESVPQFYRDIVGDQFGPDLGDGNFLQTGQGIIRLLTFVSFDIPVESPCEYMIQNQFSRLFVFRQRAGTNFQRQRPPSGEEESDPPPANPSNSLQEPGELVDKGGGRFGSYDIPGPRVFTAGGVIPADVMNDRFRLIFRVEITCSEDGRVVKRFYWMIEITLPYDNGVLEFEETTSSVRQISSVEYDNAEMLFGQNHE